MTPGLIALVIAAVVLVVWELLGPDPWVEDMRAMQKRIEERGKEAK